MPTVLLKAALGVALASAAVAARAELAAITVARQYGISYLR